MAKIRSQLPTTEPEAMFARSPGTWRLLGAPPFMYDDQAAVTAFDRWLGPGRGPARLRAATNMSTPAAERLKVDYLRRQLAPRILWEANALTDAERAQLIHYRRRGPQLNVKAPAWLRCREPWLDHGPPAA